MWLISHWEGQEYLFQELVQGDNVRVHVIDGKIVSILIQAKQVDYRYDKQPIFIDYILPKKIESMCVDVCKKLNLNLCGIDIIVKDGRYYFLEANPSPGYDYYERKMQHNFISAYIYEFFSRRLSHMDKHLVCKNATKKEELRKQYG